MPYTKNVKQIQNSIIPALERELAGAKARKDKETADAIEQEIARMKTLAGIEVAVKVPPENTSK